VTPEVRRVLELRVAVSQAAVKKYAALENQSREGRFYNGYQLNGASRTGRWSHRGFQPGNLKRPDRLSSPDMVADLAINGSFDAVYGGSNRELELLGSAIRGAIAAPEGKRLVVSDLSNIESRTLGWVTGCKKINDTHADNKDPYKTFATDWLGIPYDQVDKATRNLCKPPDLGAGYRLGAKGLVAYADGMGVKMRFNQAEHAIQVWRATRWEVPAFWEVCEHATASVLGGRGPWESNGLKWELEGDFLTIRLPSGRKLYYYQPKWEQVMAPWGSLVWNLTYWGMDSFSKKWQKITSHGGKTTEQVNQAMARDILVHGMLLYSMQGGTVVGHVHDECIAEEDEGVADQALTFLDECLSVTPPWAPGLILKAKGYTSSRYRKD